MTSSRLDRLRSVRPADAVRAVPVVGEEIILLHGDTFVTLKLNRMGAVMWNMISSRDLSTEEALRVLAQYVDVCAVERFVNSLLELSFLTLDPPKSIPLEGNA